MNRPLIIHLDYCLTPGHRINNAAIVIQDKKILAMGGYSAFTHIFDYERIELPGCYAAPGFIDTHLYGAGGYDCMHAAKNPDIAPMSKALAEHGVTSFVPTTQSTGRQKLQEVVKALARICKDGDSLPGAVPVGIHVEGPFLSYRKRGAHPEQYIRPIDLEEARAILEAGEGMVKIFTFAPEHEEAIELTKMLCKADVTPALGHTMAGRVQVLDAIEAGARRCSHLFNGMEPLQQRKVGLAAIAMMDDRIWTEIIPDGIHILPGMIDLTCRCTALDKIIAISNSNEAAGLDVEGIFSLGDEHIKVQNGVAVLEGSGDVIAGSINCLDENFQHLMEYSHLSHEEALAAVTINPATSIGLTDRGQVKPGKRADIVIMDNQHQVVMTIVNGKIVFEVDWIDELKANAEAPA
jgi:N-acetylglucosamine-6-phosphate deacetylase